MMTKQFIGGEPGRELDQRFEREANKPARLRAAEIKHSLEESNKRDGFRPHATANRIRIETVKLQERKEKELRDFVAANPRPQHMVEGDE